MKRKMERCKSKSLNSMHKVLVITFLIFCFNCDIISRQGFPSPVSSQKIDCTSGFLCDFFKRFPHLPFTQLHPNNAGYIRTLDYMISKEGDVTPHPPYYLPATDTGIDNYYQTELSEIRKQPLYSPTSTINGRHYEPQVRNAYIDTYTHI